MFHSCRKQTISVAQIGPLETEELRRALFTVNKTQHPFFYDLLREKLPLADKYKLPNGGFDLCEVTEHLVCRTEYKNLPRPLVLISSVPFGELGHGDEEDFFFFYSHEVDYDPDVSIISTFPWRRLAKSRSLHQYIFLMLAVDLLAKFCKLEFHGEDALEQGEEERSCLLNFCNELEEIEACFQAGRLCGACSGYLNSAIRQREIGIERVAAIMRIYNLAIKRKCCFIVMPFRDDVAPVHGAIADALKNAGWMATRADEVSRPQRITTTIELEILMSDLVIADLTGGNPNVLYEIGITHSLGRNLILIIREGESIPFDLKDEPVVHYTIEDGGILKLQRKILASLQGM